jgi:hypothetical protein
MENQVTRLLGGVRPDPLNQGSRRHAGNEGNRLDRPSSALHHIASDDAIDRPIAPFDQHVWLQRRDQIERVRLGKDDDVVDAAQRGKHFRAIGFSHDGPIGRFVQALGGCIAVDPDDENIAERLGRLKISRVADVHEVETPVGEDDALLVPARLLEQGNQLRRGHDFRHTPIIPTACSDGKTTRLVTADRRAW